LLCGLDSMLAGRTITAMTTPAQRYGARREQL
jgi:hypothetical protein